VRLVGHVRGRQAAPCRAQPHEGANIGKIGRAGGDDPGSIEQFRIVVDVGHDDLAGIGREHADDRPRLAAGSGRRGLRRGRRRQAADRLAGARADEKQREQRDACKRLNPGGVLREAAAGIGAGDRHHGGGEDGWICREAQMQRAEHERENADQRAIGSQQRSPAYGDGGNRERGEDPVQ
jgi:hypothetical protein